MILLTGKFKESFEQWLKNEMYYLGNEKLSDLFWCALIVEYFDSINLFITIISKLSFRKKRQRFGYCFLNYKSQFLWDSRQEALQEAIINVNNYFNNKN